MQVRLEQQVSEENLAAMLVHYYHYRIQVHQYRIHQDFLKILVDYHIYDAIFVVVFLWNFTSKNVFKLPWQIGFATINITVEEVVVAGNIIKASSEKVPVKTLSKALLDVMTYPSLSFRKVSDIDAVNGGYVIKG